MSCVEWSDVTYELGNGKVVLDGVSGRADAGRLLAVLGPSGAGKTSLLAALAKQLQKQSGATLTGSLNFHPGAESPHTTSPSGVPIAYVAQETAFFSNLTVWETVLLAAKLRSDAPDEAIEQQAKALVTRLGLNDCIHTRVGGDTGGRMVTGISGGEKRRLSIACELAGSSAGEAGILVADEPTSGLDAFQADLVVAKLKELAASTGSVVLCSLHQPRAASMDRVDDLLLMAPGGGVAYMGPLGGCLPHFERLGHRCPPQHSIAEFAVDLVSIDTSSEAAQAASRNRISELVRQWRLNSSSGAVGKKTQSPGATSNLSPPVAKSLGSSPASQQQQQQPRQRGPLRRIFREFRLLFGRVARQARRDMWNHAARGAASLILGVAYGATNFRLGSSQNSVKKRASMMFQLCITTSMMSLVKTLNSFPRERVTVRREMSRGAGRGGYSTASYLLSKMLVETPIDAFFPALFGLTVYPLARLNARRLPQFLGIVTAQSMAASTVGMAIGAACPSVDTALALGPALMVVSIMVADESGMFAEIPASMKPLAKVSVVKWGFQGTMAAEMKGLTFDRDDSLLPKVLRDATGPKADAQRRAAMDMCLTTGEEVLLNLGFGNGALRAALGASGGIYLANVVASYLSMRLQGSNSRGLRLSGNMSS